jgi:hypothetical protein
VRLLSRVILYVALIAAPFIAASLWLDAHGDTATATVTGKREEIGIAHEPTGGWYSRRYLEVEFPRLAAVGLRGSVRVDSAEFEAYRRGDRVTVRYFPCCPIFTRLAGHTTRRVTWEVARELGSDPLLDWAALGLVALILASRVASVLVVGTGLAWLAAGLIFLFPARPPRVPTGVETTARVAGLSLVTESPRHTRNSSSGMRSSRAELLRVPYEVVQLRYVPAGGADSVLAVDEVDAGSVPLLSPGDVVRVRYQPATPHEALLVEGTRTFRQRNRFHFLFLVLGWVGIGVAAGLAWRLRGRRRAAAAA